MISKNKEDIKLFNIAKKYAKQKKLTEQVRVGDVGCAILSKKNKIYSGKNFSGDCGIDFCAEVNAILEMIKNGETEIKKLVAVDNKHRCLPPCGRCREFMFQVNKRNLETEIILEKKIVKLKDIFPERWQDSYFSKK